MHADPSETNMDARSIQLRRMIVDAVASCRKGHLGPALSLVEILSVLYDSVLRYDPARPDMPERDRFVLSKGHGCLALYVLLADKGFFPMEAVCNLYSPGCFLGGHPERGKIPGIEVSTGSLGHGLSVSIGFALNARMTGNGVRVFTVLGDGECNEGSVWEAAMCAAKHRLDNLCVLVDHNKLQSYGPVCDVLNMAPFADKWRSFGFTVHEVNGHDPAALRGILADLPLESGRPTAVICHTIKGRGFPWMEQNPAWHHRGKLTDDDIAAMYSHLESLDA